MRALLLLILSLARGTTAAAEAGAANATWTNVGNDLSLSVYEKPVECYARDPILRVGIKNWKPGTASATLKPGQTDYCLFFLDDKPPAVGCGSGSLELSFDEKTNEFRGKYQFRLNDSQLRERKRTVGEVRSGEFVAQYCKPRRAAKK